MTGRGVPTKAQMELEFRHRVDVPAAPDVLGRRLDEMLEHLGCDELRYPGDWDFHGHSEPGGDN